MQTEWRMVPVVPTEEMLTVMHRDVLISVNARRQSASILNDKAWWAKVLAAAPVAPAAQHFRLLAHDEVITVDD